MGSSFSSIKKDNKDELITKIQTVAKRALWLGNDETHYLRKWEDKDLTDLRKLIDLTIHWIEMEKLSEEYIEDMPDKKDKSTL